MQRGKPASHHWCRKLSVTRAANPEPHQREPVKNPLSSWPQLPAQVLSGARVPADGEVVEGRSHVDESMVTGESKPAAKRPGDGLISGTVNCSGPLVMKVCCLTPG